MSARQEDRRANQKARTRAAIVEAAHHLLALNITPTVATAADEASVSRATAYRYFPTQEALLVELESETLFAPLNEVLDGMTSTDPEERLLALFDAFERFAVGNEPYMRMALRVYQDTWLRGRQGTTDAVPTIRQGRRMLWLDQVLEPIADLPEERMNRLKRALALTIGADSFVILKDVCRLTDPEAFALLRWAAIALLRAALEDTAYPT